MELNELKEALSSTRTAITLSEESFNCWFKKNKHPEYLRNVLKMAYDKGQDDALSLADPAISEKMSIFKLFNEFDTLTDDFLTTLRKISDFKVIMFSIKKKMSTNSDA